MERVIVFMKQVPTTASVGFSKENNTFDRAQIPAMINPGDLCALEAALSLRDETGCAVAAITMGPASSESLLREVAARGVSELFHVSAPVFAGSDTFATATILARSLRHVGPADLLLCGRRAIDGETGQTGPEIAELLDLPCVTNVLSLALADAGTLVCERLADGGHERVAMSLPGLATLCEGMNRLRPPSIAGLRKALSAKIEVLDNRILGIDPDTVGARGSCTRVRRLFPPGAAGRRGEIELDPGRGAEHACRLVAGILGLPGEKALQ